MGSRTCESWLPVTTECISTDSHKMPPLLLRLTCLVVQKRIRGYYSQFWLRQAEEADEAELLSELPHALRTEALWSMSHR